MTGVRKILNLCDVINEWPLIVFAHTSHLNAGYFCFSDVKDIHDVLELTVYDEDKVRVSVARKYEQKVAKF